MILRRSALAVLFLVASGCSSGPAFEGKSVDELRKMLKHADATRRAEAAHGLARYGPDAAPAVPELTNALEDENLRVRIESAQALGQIGRDASSAVPALIARLKDPDSVVRKQAAAALGQIGDPAALSALREALNDETPFVAQAAQEAIGRLTKPD